MTAAGGWTLGRFKLRVDRYFNRLRLIAVLRGRPAKQK